MSTKDLARRAELARENYRLALLDGRCPRCYRRLVSALRICPNPRCHNCDTVEEVARKTLRRFYGKRLGSEARRRMAQYSPTQEAAAAH